MATLRNGTIDVARGLGILLVVLGHNWLIQSGSREAFRVIFSFHMPLFFVLSGIFLRPQNAIALFARARFDSLLKPYFAVLLTLGVAKQSVVWFVGEPQSELAGLRYLAGIFYATGATIDWIPMWFLPYLFVSAVASLAVLKLTSGKTTVVTISAALSLLVTGVFLIRTVQQSAPIAAWLHGGTGVAGWPWSVDLVPATSAWMIVGYIVGQNPQSIRYQRGFFTAALVGFCGLHAMSDETIDFNMRIYGDVVVTTLQAALGVFLVFGCADLLQRSVVVGRALGYIGAGSLFILIFHPFFQDKTFRAALRYFETPIPSGIAGFAAGVVGPLLLCEVAKRSRYLSSLLLPRPKLRCSGGEAAQTQAGPRDIELSPGD